MGETRKPLGFLITFTCYGTRLHGSSRGSVDRLHNRPGSSFAAPDQALEVFETLRMGQPYFEFDRKRAMIALQAMIEVAGHRKWCLRAAHLRPRHVHLVVLSASEPRRITVDMKSYASRALNRAGCDDRERKRWTRGGSGKYLWTEEDVNRAVHYVLHGQGKPFVRHGADIEGSPEEYPRIQPIR